MQQCREWGKMEGGGIQYTDFLVPISTFWSSFNSCYKPQGTPTATFNTQEFFATTGLQKPNAYKQVDIWNYHTLNDIND